VPISNELLVVLKRFVATNGEDHDSGYIIFIDAFDPRIVGRATDRGSSQKVILLKFSGADNNWLLNTKGGPCLDAV
jgi:hypothetical protein